MDKWQDDIALLGALADAARAASLPHFRKGITANNKAKQGFDPVTAADTAVENAVRALLAEHRPEDGIVGEEGEDKSSRSGRHWIIDPIDGTRAFLTGLPSWCVLIALADETGPVLSVIDQPHIKERFFGLNAGDTRSAWLEHDGRQKSLATRQGASLKTALGETTDAFLFKGLEWEAFQAVRAQARLFRYGLDAYGYAMVAAGGLDFVMESELKAWDVAALIPVVEGAGGVVTDWAGNRPQGGGQILASAHPALHAEILPLLAAAAQKS